MRARAARQAARLFPAGIFFAETIRLRLGRQTPMDGGASLCGSVALIASKASGVTGIETMRAYALLSY
jgi:hypothetical protein